MLAEMLTEWLFLKFACVPILSVFFVSEHVRL